jgi:hypothetical protein
MRCWPGKTSLENGLNDPKVLGRHFAFDEQLEIQSLEWIRSHAEKCAPLTRTDLRHHSKLNIPVIFPGDGSILSFCVTKPIYLKRKVLPKKMRDWNFPELFWMSREIAS